MEIQTTTRLGYRGALDAEGLVAFLARRAVPGVEQVAAGAYRRSMRLAGGPAVAELRPGTGCFEARFLLSRRADADEAVTRARRLLDLDAEPGAIAGALGGDPVVGPLVRAAPGRRLPGAVDGGELAVRAVLGQQVSLVAARTLAERLVLGEGERLARPLGAVTHLFPTPAALAATDPGNLAMPTSRRRAVLGLAAALAGGELVLAPGVDRAEAERALLAIPGIGPWTSAYVAMRALGDADAFPAADLGIRRALERLGRAADPGSAASLAEHWRPFRAYAAQHLWASLS